MSTSFVPPSPEVLPPHFRNFLYALAAGNFLRKEGKEAALTPEGAEAFFLTVEKLHERMNWYGAEQAGVSREEAARGLRWFAAQPHPAIERIGTGRGPIDGVDPCFGEKGLAKLLAQVESLTSTHPYLRAWIEYDTECEYYVPAFYACSCPFALAAVSAWSDGWVILDAGDSPDGLLYFLLRHRLIDGNWGDDHPLAARYRHCVDEMRAAFIEEGVLPAGAAAIPPIAPMKSDDTDDETGTAAPWDEMRARPLPARTIDYQMENLSEQVAILQSLAWNQWESSEG